jgi:hypothetical protein
VPAAAAVKAAAATAAMESQGALAAHQPKRKASYGQPLHYALHRTLLTGRRSGAAGLLAVHRLS